MGNCMYPATAAAALDALPTPTPVLDEKDKIIANLKLDFMRQKLELEQKCQGLELKCRRLTMELERSEDDYREQVAVSTELKAQLWLLKSEAIPRMRELAFLRCSRSWENE